MSKRPAPVPVAITMPASVPRRVEDLRSETIVKVARSLARSQIYQSAADAPSTLRAYKADLADIKAWCVGRDLEPMPSTPDILGACLADAGRGYAPSTLRRRVTAIAPAHRMTKHPLDMRHPAIRETLRGIARTHGEPARRSAAITTADIKRLLIVCGSDLRDQGPDAVSGLLRRRPAARRVGWARCRARHLDGGGYAAPHHRVLDRQRGCRRGSWHH